MYIDKLDGRIDHSLFAQMSEQWRFEQDKLQQDISLHRVADQSYLDEGVGLLELASRAQRLFAKQEPREQRRLLNFVLSNSTWKGGELAATFRQPFDFVAETAAMAAKSEAGHGLNSPACPMWLGD